MNRFTFQALGPLPIIFGLTACGGTSNLPKSAVPSNPCGANPCGDSNPCGANPCGDIAATGDVDWSSWQSWAMVNKSPFPSKGHQSPWVNVYVAPDHLEAYKAAGEKPEGFAVVKVNYADEAGSPGAVKALTVMKKMGSDYDPDNGNWWYGVVSPDGKELIEEGKLAPCSDCHSAGEDYLFSDKVAGN